MAVDAHKNFAISSVVTPPSPAVSGTTVTLQTGEGARMPAVPFNGTFCPLGQLQTPLNAEIVRVTAMSGDTITAMLRAQENTTARAILAGDLFFGGMTAKSLQDIETGYAAKDAVNVFSIGGQDFQDATNGPRLRLRHLGAPANLRAWQLNIDGGAGNLYVVPLNDDASAQAPYVMVDRAGNLYEKARTVPMGHTIAVPFNAANFTANVGTWTVSGGNVLSNLYSIVGKRMFWDLYISSSVVSGGPSSLQCPIPGGFTGAAYQSMVISVQDGTTWKTGYAFVVAGTGLVYFRLDPVGGIPWAASSTCFVLATMQIPIL